MRRCLPALLAHAAWRGRDALGAGGGTVGETGIRVSTKGPYARAFSTLRPRYRTQADQAMAILKRTAGRWRVIDFGSSEVGCSLPRAVRQDLRPYCFIR